MKTLTILFIYFVMSGFTCLPRTAWGQDIVSLQRGDVHQHYAEFLGQRTELRRLKMDILSVEGKLGSINLTQDARKELANQLTYDEQQLTSTRVAFVGSVQYLMFHLYELAPDEKTSVELALFYTE